MDNLQTLASSDSLSTYRRLPSLTLDLNQLLIRQSGTTHLFRISGHNWADQGVFDGDIAVIDRAAQAGSSDLIISWGPTGMELLRQHQLSYNDKPWGVVTAVIHQFRP